MTSQLPNLPPSPAFQDSNPFPGQSNSFSSPFLAALPSTNNGLFGEPGPLNNGNSGGQGQFLNNNALLPSKPLTSAVPGSGLDQIGLL